MANWQKKGADGNVDSGEGSKGSKGGGNARGPSVALLTAAKAAAVAAPAHLQPRRPGTLISPRAARPRCSASRKPASRHRCTSLRRLASPTDRGPGEKFAEGGKGKMFGFAGALPATAGISAARES